MPPKITYATLGGDELEDLHRALGDAITSAPQSFGREYFLQIDGRPVRAAGQFDDRSPIDTTILLGSFQQATKEHVRAAITAARAAHPAWAAQPWQERLVTVR